MLASAVKHGVTVVYSLTLDGKCLPGREAALACLAGAIWGVYNGAFAITFAFAPLLLIGAGLAAGVAGSLVAVATWLSVASVQAAASPPSDGGTGPPCSSPAPSAGGWGCCSCPPWPRPCRCSWPSAS